MCWKCADLLWFVELKTLTELLQLYLSLTALFTSRGQLKCDGTRAETRFRLLVKRTSPFKSAGGVSSVEYWQPRCVHHLSLLVVMLDTPCSRKKERNTFSSFFLFPGVLWRVLATHSLRQFPLHFPSRASPCTITFQLESTFGVKTVTLGPNWELAIYGATDQT